MIGTSLALLISGGILILFFVAAMVGGLVNAFADIEGDADFNSEIAEGSVLHLTFEDPLVERGAGESFSVNFMDFSPQKTIGLNDLLSDLDRAANDDNIAGILLEVQGVGGYPSTLGEVRKALLKFKESGKWIVSWSETQSQKAYWLCSVADEMLLHPEGMADMLGISMETMYMTGLFEKLGVEIQVLRGPNNLYKSAVEPYTRKNMSEPNREQLTALLEDFWAEMRTDIASARDLSSERIDEIANDMLLRSAQAGIDLNLYDGLMYKDELVQLLEEKGVSMDDDNQLELVSIHHYHNPSALEDMLTVAMSAMDSEEDNQEEDLVDGSRIAVVYAVGGIQSGEGDDQTIGSARIARALREARLDSTVSAVVLRVNSPGGSALASDVIWRETVKLREAGKPVVASMSDLAASGGYYISCAADKIFCQPNTITGSIGVFGMLPNFSGLLEGHMGLRYDHVKLHDHANMFTGHTNLDTEERVLMNGVISDIYSDFISRVAEGRGLTIDEVDHVARGRVWTGQDAMEIGLVDEFGGLKEALEAAAELSNLSNYDVIELPETEDPFEAFVGDLFEAQHTASLQELVGLTDLDIGPIQQVKEIMRGDRYQSRLLLNFQIN